MWLWALLVTCSLLQFDAEAGAITMLFHYHKTGHDLIISVSESLVKKQMVRACVRHAVTHTACGGGCAAFRTLRIAFRRTDPAPSGERRVTSSSGAGGG
jgi:hypothetical protein